MTFTSFVSGNDVVVIHYADDRLLMAGGRFQGDATGEAPEERAIELLEAFEPGRLADWTPPAAEEKPSPGIERPPAAEAEVEAEAKVEAERAPGAEGPQMVQNCGGDMECFLDSVTACEPARAATAAGPSVAVLYRVEGEADGGMCQLSFRFTENPNPELVDQPMLFTVDPDNASHDAIRNTMTGCLEGNEDAIEAHACEGPLVGAMGG